MHRLGMLWSAVYCGTKDAGVGRIDRQIETYDTDARHSMPEDKPRETPLIVRKCKIIKKIRDKRLSYQKNFLPLHHQSPGGGMVDALVSGASVERRAGSSPVLGTIRSKADTSKVSAFFYL